MQEGANLLAYCGLYCGDCAGYTGEIADATKILIKILEKYKFSRTAAILFSEPLADYDKLEAMLGFMATLKCPLICREREAGGTDCQIWQCCRERGFYACYECDAFEVCDRLKAQEALHGDACVKNLRAIKEMGLEAWIGSGKRLWFGSEVDDGK